MKGKLFYDHLIIIEEIEAKLGGDAKLLELVDRTMHHEILDVIFTYLPKEKHEEFLQKFHSAPHDPKLLVYLTTHTSINIELAILDRANKVKRRLTNIL